MPRQGRSRRFAILSEEAAGVVDVTTEGQNPQNPQSPQNLSRSDGSKSSVSPSVHHKLSPATTAKSPNKLQSLFSPFAKSQDKMDQLTELLNGYSVHGCPPLPDWITRGRPLYDPNSLRLERHWTDLVAQHELMNKRQRDQQEAVWELLTTEVEYIRKVRVIIDLFYCCLVNLQANQLLNEINIEMVFSNVCDVFYATCHFWVVHMKQVLSRSRETSEPLDPSLLKSGFQVFDKLFEPYVKYCLDLENCRDYLKCKVKDNDLFRTFITWAEGQSQCSRLSLVDLISKPFQRITKYALLLFAIKKPLDKMEPNGNIDQQKRDISKMVQQVERFVLQLNKAMRQRHEHMQLSLMMDRIDSYEAVDVPSDECLKLTEQFCKLDLSMPMSGCGEHERRNLLYEGCLKFKDNYTKTDVYCFLFTDMLLITKPTGKRGDKVKVIKPPMRLDRIVVQSMRDSASFMILYLNEYSMAQAVYLLHGDSKLWMAHITKAQRDFQERRKADTATSGPGMVRESDRGSSCDTALLLSLGAAKDPVGERAYDPGSQYRSQLSVPALFESPEVGEAFQRRISSERIKRKVLGDGSHPGDGLRDLCRFPGDDNSVDGMSRLSTSTCDLPATGVDQSLPNAGGQAKRPSVTRQGQHQHQHRRHSSDPIRDLESLNTALLSSSFPGSSEDQSPSAGKLDWNLGEASAGYNQTETDAETPSSGKTSDGSSLNLESAGSKASLNMPAGSKAKAASSGDFVSPDKSNSEPDFCSKYVTTSEETVALVSIRPLNGQTIPVIRMRQPSFSVETTIQLTSVEEWKGDSTEPSSDLPGSERAAQDDQDPLFHGNASTVTLAEETVGRHEIVSDPEDPKRHLPKSVEVGSETESEPLHSCKDDEEEEEEEVEEERAAPPFDEVEKTKRESTSEASESNRTPEEEFHMCYLPEEYSSLPSPPKSPDRAAGELPIWEDAPPPLPPPLLPPPPPPPFPPLPNGYHLEAGSQTPLHFLVAGYFDLIGISDVAPLATCRPTSKSLPDVSKTPSLPPLPPLPLPEWHSRQEGEEVEASLLRRGSSPAAAGQSEVH